MKESKGRKCGFRTVSGLFCALVLCLLFSACASRFPDVPQNTEPAPIETADVTAEAAENTVPEAAPEETEPKFVEIGGAHHHRKCEYMRLSSEKITAEELFAVLPEFPNLKTADIRGTSVTQDEALALSEAFPYVDFTWENELFGTVYPSDTKELDISGNKLGGPAEAESIVSYFPKLEKIVMSDCGISNEDMDALNCKYENIRFVWTVRFSIYSLRTDAVYFCASDVPRRGYIAPRLNENQLEPLKYCTDLVALDLGHMNYRNVEFLSGLTKLKYLILVQSWFGDLSPLANMHELEYLELFANNRIVDLTPLLECKNLKHLNIGYCYFAQWETLKDMKQLERLWMPHVRMTKSEKKELQEALPDTYIYCPNSDRMGSTGGGWREDQSYYDMRDALHMFYLPGGTGM